MVDAPLALSLMLDEFRPLLEEVASEQGLVLDFLMRRWNGRFATYNVGLPTEAVVDPRPGGQGAPRHYKLLGRVKANTRAGTLLITLSSPTACDLSPNEAEVSRWGRFQEALLLRVQANGG